MLRVAPRDPSAAPRGATQRVTTRNSTRTVSGGGGVEAEGGGGGEVEALGAAVDGDADATVGEGRDVGWEAPGLVAEQPGSTPPHRRRRARSVRPRGRRSPRPRHPARRPPAGGTGCRRWPGRSWGCR